MKQRVITGIFIAIVYIGAVLGAILWNPIVFDVFILFLMYAAGFEVCQCLEAKCSKTVKPLFVICVALQYIAYKIVMYYAGLIMALISVVLLTILLAVIVLNFTMFSKKYAVSGGGATAFVLFYPTIFLFVTLSLAYLPGGLSSGAVILVFIGSSLADVMAYFVGSALKGPKFCPEISPKKTVSGAIGGVLGGIIAGVILLILGRYSVIGVLPLSDVIWIDAVNWIALGLGTAVFCEMGDLTSSYIKRVCGIKDFGTLLAGHGGFMDRIDGLIVSAVFIFTYLFVRGLII